MQLLGRVRAVAALSSHGHPSISVGSKQTRLSDINLDIEKSAAPDIVASALHLPFQGDVFEEALFTDVIEHLPSGSETQALKELNRVLLPRGRLVFSTPNRIPLFTLLDPAYWLTRHRHYTKEQVQRFFDEADFMTSSIFTSGGVWALLSVLWYSLVIYPATKVWTDHISGSPRVLADNEDREYSETRVRGYTIFVIAEKMGKMK